MRVLLVGTSLDSGSMGQSGAHSYFVDLLCDLQKLAGTEVIVIASAKGKQWLDDEGALQPTSEVHTVSPIGGVRRIFRDGVMAGRWAEKLSVDVTIYPHEWCPPSHRPTIAIVQNIGFLHPFSRSTWGLRGWLLRMLVRLTGHRAAAIIASSPESFRLWYAASGSNESKIRPFVWTPSVTLPKMDATPLASHELLVISGESFHKRPELAVSIERWAQGREITCAVIGLACNPHVHRSTLLSMMGNSTVVTCPTAVESFGYPALEAALKGSRPIVSSNTPMAYLLRNICVEVDSNDVAPWVVGIQRGRERGRLTESEVAVVISRLDAIARPENLALALDFAIAM